MGASMTGIIEWTHDSQCAACPELKLALGVPRWDDDYLHGILFETGKEYDFFAAIAGVRSRFTTLPLIPPRAMPSHMSWPARQYFERCGAEVAGWLHLSEIEQCVRHIGADPFYLDFQIEIALDVMRMLVGKLSDSHVRLVFNIESP